VVANFVFDNNGCATVGRTIGVIGVIHTILRYSKIASACIVGFRYQHYVYFVSGEENF